MEAPQSLGLSIPVRLIVVVGVGSPRGVVRCGVLAGPGGTSFGLSLAYLPSIPEAQTRQALLFV